MTTIVLTSAAILITLILVAAFFAHRFMEKLTNPPSSSESLNERQEQSLSRTSVTADANNAELNERSSVSFPAFKANPNQNPDEEQSSSASMDSSSLSSQLSVTEMRDKNTEAHNLYLKKRQLIRDMTLSGVAISELSRTASKIDKRNDEYIKDLHEFSSYKQEGKESESIQVNREDSYAYADNNSELIFEGSDSCYACADDAHK
ncbi:hypothetical protein HNY73_012771 [Argiope bruennichi]|uniref:Uncharacterized protein n=1 Tax=Argiope bruennichi TaxID=94029 RepID=A0A8T0EXT6_ARGBR|nr:hypothetical protein HNY73_012771 [Argiope bruennichi]